MSTIEVVATIVAKPGQGDALAAAIAPGIAAARGEEGCLRYDFYRVARVDDTFVMIETYADKDALRAHGASEHFATMSAALADLVAGPPTVHVLIPSDVA